MINSEIKIVITLDNMKLISVNALYRAGLLYKGGKPVPYIYKVADAKKFEGIVDEQLRAIDWKPYLDTLKNTKYWNITNQYILKTGISSRDVSNLTKLTDDTITRFIHSELGISTFDDSKFIEEHLYKSILPGSEKEFLCVCLSPSGFEYRFDKVPRPSKFLFHSDNHKFVTKEFREFMKSQDLEFQVLDTKFKIKERDTDFYWIDGFENKESAISWTIEEALGYKYGDKSRFLFLAVPENLEYSEFLVNRVQKYSIGNVKIGIIKEKETVQDFLKKVYYEC